MRCIEIGGGLCQCVASIYQAVGAARDHSMSFRRAATASSAPWYVSTLPDRLTRPARLGQPAREGVPRVRRRAASAQPPRALPRRFPSHCQQQAMRCFRLDPHRRHLHVGRPLRSKAPQDAPQSHRSWTALCVTPRTHTFYDATDSTRYAATVCSGPNATGYYARVTLPSVASPGR